LNRKILALVVAASVVAGLVVYLSFAYTVPAIVVRLVTSNPPVEGGLILPQNEKRFWDPAVIEVKVGVEVTIVVVNNDDIEHHEFTIPEFGVRTKDIPPFEFASITFTPDKVGTFTFIDPRPTETYTYTDYRGVMVNQVVDHSVEVGRVVVKP